MKPRVPLTPQERARRARLLSATIITCVALIVVGGSLHVVGLGSLRMGEMRDKATYDVRDEPQHLRAAGEDIALHARNEKRKAGGSAVTGLAYTPEEAQALLAPAQWEELDSMVMVPAGAFAMGTDYVRADAVDRPQHRVEAAAFRIDRYLVTNAQYARFLAQTGHRPPSTWKEGRIPDGEALRPATMVSWHDASAYAKWAGKRLPTEVEWEKAARGTDGRRWPWGDTMDPKRVNTYYNVGSTSDVNTYKNGVSPYGVYDMAGNVYEWVQDDFLPYEGSGAPAEVFVGKVSRVQNTEDRTMRVSDQIEVGGRYKVLRGGCWKCDPFSTTTYHRNYNWGNYASDFFGFRCASDASGPVVAKP